MKKIQVILLALPVLMFFACGSDKSDESIPLNEIKGSYEPQLNFLNQAIEDDQDEDDLYFKRAAVYLNMFQIQFALTDIQTAIALRPERAEYYVLLSKIYSLQEKWFDAIKATEKAERLGSDDAELPVIQARIYWETEDTSRSYFYMKKVESIAPFHSDISLLKGRQAAGKGDTLRAVTYFLNALKRDHRNIPAYIDLVKMYLQRNKDDSALVYIFQAREVNPFEPFFYYAEGRVLQKKDLKQSALFSYLTCMRKDSSFAPVYYSTGQLYYRDGNYPEALKYLTSYTNFNNDRKDVYFTLIDIQNRQGRPDAAIPYYERLLVLDSTNIGLKYTLQKLYKQYRQQVIIPDTTARRPVAVQPLPIDTTRRRRRVVPVADTTAVRTPTVQDTVK